MAKHNFEIIEEGAGLHIRVRGVTLEELFSNAVRGVAFHLKPDALELKKADLKEWHKIKVEAVDIASLLVELLAKVVERTDMHGAVFPVISFEKFGENFLEGKIFGTKIDELDREIKAISFDEVDIRKNIRSGVYETELIFEV